MLSFSAKYSVNENMIHIRSKQHTPTHPSTHLPSFFIQLADKRAYTRSENWDMCSESKSSVLRVFRLFNKINHTLNDERHAR